MGKVHLVKAFCCKYNREKKLLLISKILRQNFNFLGCASLTFTKLFILYSPQFSVQRNWRA